MREMLDLSVALLPKSNGKKARILPPVSSRNSRFTRKVEKRELYRNQ